MRLRLLGFLIGFLPLAAFAQIMPGGAFTPGHAVRCVNSTCTVVTDAGGALGSPTFGTGYLTEMGITNTGTPMCVTDALTSAAGGYHQLCVGSNATIGGTTGGFVSYNAFGGATPLGLSFNINGANYGFPGPGNGNVMGPTTTTVGDFPVWNSTLGTLLKSGPGRSLDTQSGPLTTDAAAVIGQSVTGVSAQSIYNQAVMSGNATTFQTYDGVRGVTQANANSTINIAAGVTGYTLNNTVPVGQRTQTAALNGIGVCAVNSSNCWGINTIVSDNPTLANTGVTAGTGKFLFNEFDFNITSPNTKGALLRVGGTALPTSVTLDMNGVAVTKFWGAGGEGTGTALLSAGFIAADGCCATGMTLGATSETASYATGLPISFNYRDVSGVTQNMTLAAQDSNAPAGGGGPTASNDATLFLGGSGLHNHLLLVNGSLFISGGQGVEINSKLVLVNDSSNNLSVGNTALTSIAIGNGASPITINGTSTTFSAGIVLASSTVAGLPTCDGSKEGYLRMVTDANAPTYNTALSGGGSSRVLALCNSATWKAH